MHSGSERRQRVVEKEVAAATASTSRFAAVTSGVGDTETPRRDKSTTLTGSVQQRESVSAQGLRGKRASPLHQAVEETAAGVGSTPTATGQDHLGTTPHGGKARRRMRTKTPGAAMRPEELYFEAQVEAWCGMHALNNYRLGPWITKQHCREAASMVARLLGGGSRFSEHLHSLTGWLSIDVLNVLGDVGLPKRGLGLQVAPVAGETWREGGDAMVNWNNQHWTVLQCDPSGAGWMHTNSIEGPGLAQGRRRHLSEADVDALPEAIRAQSGDVALHALTPWAGGRILPPAPASDEEMERCEGAQSSDAGGAGEGHAARLSMVTLNVAGLGDDYAQGAGERMAAILTTCLAVEPAPDVLLFQEMTHEMLDEARCRLQEWRCCKRRESSEDYFNVTFLRLPCSRTSSMVLASSRTVRGTCQEIRRFQQGETNRSE